MDMAAVVTSIQAFDAGDAMNAIIVVLVGLWAFKVVRGLIGGR